MKVGTMSKRPPTERAALIVTLQVPVPVQAPLHSVNSEPGPATAFSSTAFPSSYSKLQVEPQSMPAGVEVTVPAPVPDLETESLNFGLGRSLNSAVTSLAALIVALQATVPEQAPLHLTNSEPASALAFSSTSVPDSYSAEQVEPQSMPAGMLVTLPVPVPDLETVSLNLGICAHRHFAGS